MTVDSKIKKRGRDSHADLNAILALAVAEKFEEVGDDDFSTVRPTDLQLDFD